MNGFTAKVPADGLYFDRLDVDGEKHSRTYYQNGKPVIYLVAIPDEDRPGKWTTGVRWQRKGKWLTHGWKLDSAAEAMAMIDAVAIGVEAISTGATYLGHVVAAAQEQVRDPEAAVGEGHGYMRVDAVGLCSRQDPPWGIGTRLVSSKWSAPKKIIGMDCVQIQLSSGLNTSGHWVNSLPADVKLAPEL